MRVFYALTPREGTVKLVCIECALGIKDSA
jgi:hypothetical protein